MSAHVFVDESHRSSYLVVAAYIPIRQLVPIRAVMRGLCLSGERRVHFQAESDNRRRKIVARLVEHPLRVRVYTGRGPKDATRAVLLRELVAEVLDAGAQRLVIESRGLARDRDDRREIVGTLQRLRAPIDALAYEHFQPHEDPALWIPDAVAWCFGAGGDWRRRVEPLVEKVIDCGDLHRTSTRTARNPGARRPAGSCPGSLPRPSGLG
ncbi:hypothetical protein F4560_006793 [Saccharothrix ecbatanensis]|uniref:DUF3800 domain-containing protein n=1 Tax=Saccharothrix ecbatanensis TaxID=1105145 RepID=A0A7W9M4E4_9PSEU|nr:hypothetical protein [Saccharothrix ecbatanensis]MBB5807025.1 hypothetical protein [Saccharothrix ecbatanensis]